MRMPLPREKTLPFPIAAFAFVFATLGAARPAAGATVAVDANVKYQVIDGFGASSAYASSMSTTDADLLWSTTTGAGLSLLRLHLNGGSTSETSIAKLAVARGVRVWAAPWEVKGADITGNPPKLVNAKDWASTLANFVTSMKTAGVPIYAISAENEPDSKGANATTTYTPDEMATWVGGSLGPALAATDAKLMAPETMNWYGIGDYLTALQKNADAWKYTSIVATHEYGGSPKAYPQIAQAGKAFWETEIYDTDNNEDAGMGSGLRTAKLIHEAMTISNMNAWHFWWIYPCCNDNGALWDKATNKPSKRLWVMGNFSRFVRPGYVRIGATVAPAAGVTVSAYLGAADKRVAIVAINTNASATAQAFSIANATATKVTPWVTDNANSLVSAAAVTPTANAFSYSLPAQSVTTLVVDVDGVSALGDAGTNPASGLKLEYGGSGLRIGFTAERTGPVSLKMVHPDGSVAKAVIMQAKAGSYSSQAIDCANLPEGLYMIRAECGGSARTAKFLLAR